MTISTQAALNKGTSSNDLAVAIAAISDTTGGGFGAMLASAFTPGLVTRSGLASLATHVEDKPGMILGVLDAAGAAQRAIILVGAPGAGQVLVTYAAGVPTLLFGDGANTGYQVLKLEGSTDMAAKLALGVF